MYSPTPTSAPLLDQTRRLCFYSCPAGAAALVFLILGSPNMSCSGVLAQDLRQPVITSTRPRASRRSTGLPMGGGRVSENMHLDTHDSKPLSVLLPAAPLLAANTGDNCNKDGATGEKDRPDTTVTTPAKRCAPFKKCRNPRERAHAKNPRNNNTKTLIGLKNSQISLGEYSGL